MVYELESDLQGWNMKWLVDINAGKNQILLFEYYYHWWRIEESVCEESHLLRWRDYLFLLNWIRALALVLLLKLPPRKIGALIHSMKFFSLEVNPCLYKSTVLSCMEYYCHEWAVAPSCYVDMLDRLQELVCRAVGLSLAASCEPLAHWQNVAS